MSARNLEEVAPQEVISQVAATTPEGWTFGSSGAASPDETAVKPPGQHPLLVEAEAYLRLFHNEGATTDKTSRLAEVREQIAHTGLYRHTCEELVYGTKVAWRDNP